jgi:2-polyprenyl-3-methyl-5-hydroxy-6-metoxy-1,4-benzoquinol methylase
MDLDMPPPSFDYVFASEIIEHLLDTDFFLEECQRVLKKGGVLVLTTPNFTYIRHRVEMLFGKYPVCMWPRFGAHVRMFTHEQMKNDLEKHGFRIEKWMTSYFLFSRARMRRLGRIFEMASDIYPPLLSSQILVVARKK